MNEFTPAFLTGLAPPDFSKAAKEGWYVYAYIRSRHGSHRAGTPYYIGIASRANRPFERHRCPVPQNKQHVRILRSGLNRESAIEWELFYIKRFGRKDTGGGILLNKTDGGDGACGYIMPRHIAERIGSIHRGKVVSHETRLLMSAARKGRPISEEQKEKLRQANLGRKASEETRAKLSQQRKGRKLSEDQKKQIANTLRGYIKSEESKKKQSETRIRNFASRAGMTVEEYMNTPEFKARQRDNARRRQRASLQTFAQSTHV